MYGVSHWTESDLFLFIRPSSDGTYYGMVMSVRPSVRPGLPSGRFPHFSPTPFDIWSWNFAHDFVLMYYRSSLSVVTLRQFLKELCPFVNLEYRKMCEVSRTFLLHALTYWAEILHGTLFYCTTDQVSSVGNSRLFLKELCLFLNLKYRKYTVFRTFLLHALTYWAELFHMTLFLCTTDQVRVSSFCVNFCRSYAPFGT